MKKNLIFAVFLILAIALTSPFSVSAKTKAGTKSGSFFYFFDKVFEKADLFFTFNPEKKAKKAFENAEERLAEAEELASENKPEAVKTAMENYKKNIEVLEKVLIKVPEEAKEAIKKAIEASKERQEEEIEETAELEKEVPEIKPELEETENELKEEENEEETEIKDDKKDEQFKEIEKLKKEVEALKQIAPKQPTFKIQNSQEQNKSEEVRNNAEETTKKVQVGIQRIEKDFARTLAEDEENKLMQQPRLISFKDNLGNIYIEKKDFVRKASEPFDHGFGTSYTPLCLQGISAINGNCQSEIVNWVNNRSIETGKHLNITLDSFDANSDDIFYYISYGSRKDWGYGNMRVLQSWGTNKTLSFPITEQLYNETLFENLGWSSTFFETETRKYYDKNVKLNNAGELNIQVCFNDKAEKMIDPFGEQFPDGCILFKYFILKPGYSKLTTSTQSQ